MPHPIIVHVHQSAGILPLIVGPVSAVLGFLLATVRDEFKGRAARRRREEAGFRVLLAEIQTNKVRAENNQNLLVQEVQHLKKDRSFLINEPDELQRGAWTLVQQDLPQRLAERADLLEQIGDLERRADQLNQMMRTRALYKGTRQAMNRSTESLTSHDELISQFEGELLTVLSSVESSLRQLKTAD